jgi:plasmid maintenance system antidote protein VapI
MAKSSTTTRAAALPNRVTTHPGEVFSEEFLRPLGMSANALAMALRVPATRIGAEFWMNLQAMHDLTKTRMESGREIEHDVRPRAA